MQSMNKHLRSSRLRYLALAAVSAAAITLSFGQFAQINASETPAGESAPAAPVVNVAHPSVKSLTEWDEFTGRFEAVDSVEIRSRVSGYLEAVSFEAGAIVEQGALLFKIDPRPFEADLAAANADFESAAAALQNAKAESERGRRLVERAALSQEEADRRNSARRQAEAALLAAKARVDAAKLNLEFTEIRAPVTGRISDDFVSVGNLIVGGAQGGTLLTTVVSLDPIYFEFTASEADYLKHARQTGADGQSAFRDDAGPVFVKLLDETDFDRQGKLSFVDNRLDQSTGTMRGRATFENADGVLAPGMFGRLKLAAGAEAPTLLIADSAVQTDQNLKFVWVADDDNTVERREIELGPLYDGHRIIRSGLNPKDRVIVSGTQFISAGAAVAPHLVEDTRLADAGNH